MRLVAMLLILAVLLARTVVGGGRMPEVGDRVSIYVESFGLDKIYTGNITDIGPNTTLICMNCDYAIPKNLTNVGKGQNICIGAGAITRLDIWPKL
jgi:hypothetical protein